MATNNRAKKMILWDRAQPVPRCAKCKVTLTLDPDKPNTATCGHIIPRWFCKHDRLYNMQLECYTCNNGESLELQELALAYDAEIKKMRAEQKNYSPFQILSVLTEKKAG